MLLSGIQAKWQEARRMEDDISKNICSAKDPKSVYLGRENKYVDYFLPMETVIEDNRNKFYGDTDEVLALYRTYEVFDKNNDSGIGYKTLASVSDDLNESSVEENTKLTELDTHTNYRGNSKSKTRDYKSSNVLRRV